MRFGDQKRLNKQSGFTLIEIMVVVVILAVLGSLVVPRIMDKPDQARMTKAKQDIRALEGALDLYRLDNYSYPTSDQGLEALVSNPGNVRTWKKGGYIKSLSSDPWGNPYQYLNPGRNNEVDLFSFGADGRPGGEGINADIGNWNLDQ